MTPIVFISGKAGSGKDTLAALIKERAPTTVCIAQADPLKRFAAQIFQFTEEQLWGPSECRNALDERFIPGSTQWHKARRLVAVYAYSWMAECGLRATGARGSQEKVLLWLEKLEQVSGGNLSPRIALQHLGTEFGRALDPDVWVRYAVKTAKKLLAGGYRYERAIGLVKDAQAPIPALVVVTDGRFANEILMSKMVGGFAVLVEGPGEGGAGPGLANHASEAEMNKIPRWWYTDIVVNDKAAGLEPLRSTARGLVEKFLPSPTHWSRGHMSPVCD